MKLCFFANASSIHSRRWIRWFVERGHDVSLISTTDWPDDLPPALSHHVLNREGNIVARRAAKLFRLRSLVRRIRPEILHGHDLFDGGMHAALSGAGPLVITPWGSDVLVSARRNGLARLAARFVLGRADLITCDAAHMADAIRGISPRTRRIERIQFGTDTNFFRPSLRDESLRRNLGADRDTLLVISTRSLFPIYCVETLIRAVPLVAPPGIVVRFVIAGSGPESENLVSLARELGVASRITFTGPLSGESMARHLASSDIYVSTSSSDAGIAASTAEAMASGLPSIVTDFGDNAEWIGHEEGGFLFAISDATRLARAISRLAIDPESRTRFGNRNRAFIEEKNDYHKEMSKMESLYRELL